ncbi:WAT1-related protein [Tanacetum coccineum]
METNMLACIPDTYNTPKIMSCTCSVSMATGLFYFGLRDTTATYATNFLNLIPITTFIFSTLLRIEKLELHTTYGRLKTTGALLCLAGALVVTLYKGKLLISPRHHHHQLQPTEIVNNTTKSNWSRGTLFLIGSILSFSIWFILQVKLNKVFPYKYSCTTSVCIIASIQQLIIGLCIDRSKSSWKLGWNLQLITIVYSGALATAATFCLISWAVEKKGPTYPSMFNPLSVIFVAITEALFLGQDLSVGSLLGMSVIVAGLYLFLWGKNMEIRRRSSCLGLDDEQKEAVNLQSKGTVVPTPTHIDMTKI